MTTGNAVAVAHVCSQLDGIPLAIELAAARVRVLSIEQIAARLNDRFRLLTGGGRTALPRHQTLRATMDWSYRLLSEDERALLRRLSVFAGGWTLEAAEAICSDSSTESIAVLDVLTQLVDKSLVQMDTKTDEARYRLLETVRQYGRDRLAESGEDASLRRRHFNWYVALAEQADSKLRGPEQKRWMDRLEVERDNLRTALQWSAEEPERAESGLRLAAALQWFWFMKNHIAEGQQWLGRFVASNVSAPATDRATALFGIGILARRQGDYKKAETALQESLALYRESRHQFGIGQSLHHLAHIADDHSADSEKAVDLFEESLAAFREGADKWGLKPRGVRSPGTSPVRSAPRVSRSSRPGNSGYRSRSFVPV